MRTCWTCYRAGLSDVKRRIPGDLQYVLLDERNSATKARVKHMLSSAFSGKI